MKMGLALLYYALLWIYWTNRCGPASLPKLSPSQLAWKLVIAVIGRPMFAHCSVARVGISRVYSLCRSIYCSFCSTTDVLPICMCCPPEFLVNTWEQAIARNYWFVGLKQETLISNSKICRKQEQILDFFWRKYFSVSRSGTNVS